MHDQWDARRIRSSVTPRSPIRQEMDDLYPTDNQDAAKGEKVEVVQSSVWVDIASWGQVYLHISSIIKIVYFAITLLIFSAIQHYVDLPHIEGLTAKKSALNKLFVRQGWGITISVFVLYQLVSLTLRTRILSSLKHLITRAAVTTFFFVFWCWIIFPTVEHYTATCTTHQNETLELPKRKCLGEGHQYEAIDISGHSFLLTYCMLIMSEESKEILYFLWLGRRLFKGAAVVPVNDGNWPNLSEKQIQSLKVRFPLVSPLVAISFMSMWLLTLLWDFLLIITTLYYHTFLEKVMGTFFSVSMWCLMYKVMFPRLFRLNIFSS